MQNLIPLEKRTVVRIIRSQYLDHVEKRGILPTMKVVAGIMAGAVVAVSWAYPHAAEVAFTTIWNMENHIVPKMLAVLAAFMASPLIFEHARDIVSLRSKKTPHASI